KEQVSKVLKMELGSGTRTIHGVPRYASYLMSTVSTSSAYDFVERFLSDNLGTLCTKARVETRRVTAPYVRINVRVLHICTANLLPIHKLYYILHILLE